MKKTSVKNLFKKHELDVKKLLRKKWYRKIAYFKVGYFKICYLYISSREIRISESSFLTSSSNPLKDANPNLETLKGKSFH